ncbi:MAG TPA: SpoIID/LytB domain-containing protein [Baekduia sp.]|nr:SpoIID/LytB domain-containing protein [Baekduia sp.]
MRRTAIVIVAALLAALACAPTAPAASRLVIKGHGFGHGIGLSQYGAMGYAQHGYTYRQIVGHYYEGTAIGSLGSNPMVRVLLQSGHRVVVSGVTRAGRRRLRARRTYVATASGSRVALRTSSGRRVGTYAAPLRLTAPASSPLQLHGSATNGVQDGRYRGALELRPAGGGVQAINALRLETYLRGVVAAESPAEWPAEALKAQAVVARSYAVTTDVGSASDGIDQYADTRSQMYRGVASEYPSTDAAIRATTGEVVLSHGRPVTTYFFSTSGGHTENVENSFIGALPQSYLQGVVDPYDAVSPRHTWGPFTLSRATAEHKLAGLVRGRFRGITVLQRGTSPRIVRAEVDGTNGVTQVTGPQLRQRLGLYDTWATFTFMSSKVRKPRPKPKPRPKHDTADSTGGQAAVAARRPPSVLRGRVDRARRGAHLRVQRRDGRRWRTVGRTRVRRAGRYRAALPSPGRYRIAWHGLHGPAVDVR